MPIDRHLPYAEQLRAILYERIKDGYYALAGRLPSEDELAREFGVSRATVRTALTYLAADGLLTRRQGHGTFINNTGSIEVNTHIESVWEFTRLIESSGRKASICLQAACSRPANERETKALHCEPGESVFCMERLFLAGEQPVIRSLNTLRTQLLQRQPAAEDMLLPIFEFTQRFCGLTIADAVADLSAVAADDATCALLSVAPATPLLRMDEIFYDTGGDALVYGSNYFNDKTLRLRLLQSRSAIRLS